MRVYVFSMDMDGTRRGFLAASVTAMTAGIAGCTDRLSTADTSGRTTQASFYLLYDFTRNITHDGMNVENIVPFGQHGHGWDGPTAGQHRDILSADVFVYMGDGFQPWADDIVDSIHSDNADVAVVRARDGIELLETGSDHDAHDHGDDDHEDNDTHDEHDPHFWLDPYRTAHAVENIRDGMIAVDPDHETAYQDHTDAYLEDLAGLHDDFDSALSSTSKDAVFVAGHNAFRYLGDTYGFEIYSLTGLSPDEQASASARREAQAIIEEHDIEYVLRPVLEPRSPAEQLVADTDATGVLDITALSGVTDEWVDDEFGYVELMRTINLPAFKKALDAA